MMRRRVSYAGYTSLCEVVTYDSVRLNSYSLRHIKTAHLI